MSFLNFHNKLCAVGTLKNMEVVPYKTSTGNDGIILKLTIYYISDNKIHEYIVELSATNSDKTKNIYNSYLTIANQYKTEKDFGSNADRICIIGNLETNDFYSSKRNEVVTMNRLRGAFVSRSDSDSVDGVEAVVESIITGITDEIDAKGVVTGRKKVELISVGYKEDVVFEYQNVFVEKEMANIFAKTYPVGTRAEIRLAVNNYVLTENNNLENKGIGRMPKNNMVTKRVSELVIFGCGEPNPISVTMEQINSLKAMRETVKQQKLELGLNKEKTVADNNSSSFSNTTGFGNMLQNANGNASTNTFPFAGLKN